MFNLRKCLSIALPFLLISCILVGIAESRPSHPGQPVAHIVIAILFLIALGLHIWTNRKAYVKYFSKQDRR
jgi:hypothetical protein